MTDIFTLTVTEVRHAPDGQTLGQRFRAAVKAAKDAGNVHLEARLIEARDAREAELASVRPSSRNLSNQIKELARAPRDEMIAALVVVARERAHSIGLEEAIRTALDTAYDVGRMAVVLDFFKRSIDREIERVNASERVQ